MRATKCLCGHARGDHFTAGLCKDPRCPCTGFQSATVIGGRPLDWDRFMLEHNRYDAIGGRQA